MKPEYEGTGTWLCAFTGTHYQTGQPAFWHIPVAGFDADYRPLVYNDGALQNPDDIGPWLLYEMVTDALPKENRLNAQHALARTLGLPPTHA